MAIQFRKATKELSRLRLSIQGPAKSGKTYTSLKIATEMDLGRIAFIDTERGSAAKYSREFEFDVFELEDFHPDKYIEAIHAAEKAGYPVLIIDSTTHEWNGRNGILELHEAAIQRQKTKNTWTAWADVTPLHTRFIDAILQSKCHIIASVRSKTEYVQDKDDRGQTQIRKVGMAAIQRAEMDYEYDIMIEMDMNHVGVIAGTRCVELDGRTFKKPGREVAEIIVAWLTDGAEPAPEKKPEPAGAPQVAPETLAAIEALWPKYGQKLGGKVVTFADYLHQKKGISDPRWMTQEEATKMLEWLQEQEHIASKALIEEINGPISAALREISETGLTDADILDKIIQITQTEGNLSTMEYLTLVEVRDRLRAWLDELKDQLTETEEVVAAQPEAAEEVKTVSI